MKKTAILYAFIIACAALSSCSKEVLKEDCNMPKCACGEVCACSANCACKCNPESQ